MILFQILKLRIGVSNYNAEQVEEVIETFKEAPAVNQALAWEGLTT